jgi:hypothetical protein
MVTLAKRERALKWCVPFDRHGNGPRRDVTTNGTPLALFRPVLPFPTTFSGPPICHGTRLARRRSASRAVTAGEGMAGLLQRLAQLIGGGERTRLEVPLTAIRSIRIRAAEATAVMGASGFEPYEPPQKLMRDTESWKLWVIVASTFLLLVGYQYWAVPETYVIQYGWTVVLKGATLAALRQFIALLVPVALVLLAGLIVDRVAPPKPD